MSTQVSPSNTEDNFVDTMLSQVVKSQKMVITLAMVFLAYASFQFQNYAADYWFGLATKSLNIPWLRELTNMKMNITAMLIYVFVLSIMLQSSFWIYAKEVYRHVSNMLHIKTHKSNIPADVSFRLFRKTIGLIVIGVVMAYPWYLGFATDIVAQYAAIQGDPITTLNFKARLGVILGTLDGRLMNSLSWVVAIALSVGPELLAAAPSMISNLRGADPYEEFISRNVAVEDASKKEA